MIGVAAAHHLYPMRCLPRAVALRWALAGLGVAAELKIGVRRAGDGFLAHAWVEAGGRPLGEPAPAPYLPLEPRR
jgi:hypothetical protein